MIYKASNIYYFGYLNAIGGIESHLYYIAKKYSNLDIAIAYRNADATQLKRLQKHIRCIRLSQKDIVKCNNLFCCFNMDVLNQVTANKKYLVLHGDYKDMLLKGQIEREELPIDERIDEYLGVSQLVCDSWEEITGIKARNVYEPVILDEVEKPLMFMSATRLTREKGWERMKILAHKMNEAKINYQWFVYTNSPKEKVDNLVFVPPRLDITNKMASFDAYIQLSDNEGFCLSVAEALLRGVPVICTDLPVLKEIGLNDKNSIKLPLNMSHIPLEKIRNIHKLKFKYELPEDKWDSVIDHTEKVITDKFRVMATNGYEMLNLTDVQLNRKPKVGDVWEIDQDRLETLLRFEEEHNVNLIEVL